MESDDADAAEPAPEIPVSTDTQDTDPADPRARWRTMAPPVRPDTWVADHDADPLPESLLAAEADRESRERQYLVERGGGFG